MDSNSLDPDEIRKFASIAGEWWDKNGEFKLLHEINYLRVEYIRKFLHGRKKVSTILDVGCGGGILTESMAKCGYKITGIDPAKENIEIAKSHAGDLKIDYQISTIEEFVGTKKFDVVLCMEVIEHVQDLYSFLEHLASLVNKNGFLFLSTINRTVKSYLQAILGAEYLLRWLPRGTHQWKKFVTPDELRKILANHDVKLCNLNGTKYNFIANDWELSNDPSVNYILVGQKLS